MTSFYNLIWRRGDSVLNLPVGLATSVVSSSESDTLVCDNCRKTPEKKGQKILKQKYVCQNCEEEFTSVGMIKMRFDAKNKVLYSVDEKRQFLQSELDREIEVKSEVPLTKIATNHIEIINAFSPLEIYSNDNAKFKQAIGEIWLFLSRKEVALLIEAKYRGDNFLGYIIATDTGKLVLVKLKDDKLIKQPYTTSNIPIAYTPLNFTSVKAEKEKEFITAIKEGRKLEIVERKQEIVPIISQDFFK
jgi:hypothetical protein